MCVDPQGYEAVEFFPEVCTLEDLQEIAIELLGCDPLFLFAMNRDTLLELLEQNAYYPDPQ